jgi:quercetin dioxygenase-like cupin family protein
MDAKQQTFADVVVVRQGDICPTSPEPGLTRRVGAYNQNIFLAEHRMQRGWVGLPHSHPHDQVVYVVSGYLKLTIANETYELRSGESLVVRGGIEHQALAVEETVAIDVFTPCRLDYI